MPMDRVAYEYLSCAAARTPHIADWVRLHTGTEEPADALVFGVHHSFALWLQPCVRLTLLTQSSMPMQRLWPTQSGQPVHVLKAIPSEQGTPSILLGTYGGAWELWHWVPPASCAEQGDWVCDACVVDAHAAPVTALGVLRDAYSLAADDDVLFVTGSSDGTIQVHARTAHAPLATQTLPLHGAYPLDVALVRLPTPQPVVLMATALTDRRLVLYTREGHEPFVRQLALDGHEDWIRALDATVAPDAGRAGSPLCVYIASAAQDQHIRLWKLKPHVSHHTDATDDFEALAREILPDNAGLQTKQYALPLGAAGRWAVSLDALLLGHDAWVTSVRWHPQPAEDGAPRAALVSSSVDNSVIVWMPQSTSAWPSLAELAAAEALWLPMHRLGDVGSLSGGFLGALWRPSASPAVLAHDRQGAWHLWCQEPGLPWASHYAISGHAGAATSLAWAPHGDGFLSTGADRTTRLHGLYEEAGQRAWHELARPQTHGYAVQAAAWLDRTSFVSAADEKVLRVFTAPQAFLDRAAAGGLWQTPILDTTAVLVDVPHDQWGAAAALAPAVRRAMVLRTPRVAVLLCAEALATADRSAIEACLQTLYTQAWACATAQDDWFVDIRVYLVPGLSSEAATHQALSDWAVTHAPLRAMLLVRGVWEVDARAHTALAPDLTPERIDAAPVTSTTKASPQATPHGRVAAVGGTFDHLHTGHKLLLSMAALCASDELVVGVTAPEMLTKKKHVEYVEPLDVRQAAVRDFVRDFCAPIAPIALDVVTLCDACGPAGTRADVDVLVLTDETAAGGELVANMRAERQLPPVAPYVVRLIDAQGHAEAQASSKLGSTAIRAHLAASGVTPGAERRRSAPKAQAAAAHVPPLGLSNRAVDEAVPIAPSTLPGAEELQALTLWPEIEKLYGHAYELLSVAVEPRSRLVASTCKATTEAHAVVRLFDGMDAFRPLAPLEGHALSITRVAFSPDGAYLLTVSRDRSWRVYERTSHGYVCKVGERAHARIVWDGAWAPSSTRLFATASRDKSVKVWSLSEGERPYELRATLTLPGAATAVAWHDACTLAVGLEHGEVHVYRGSADARTWSLLVALPHHHTGAVHELAFRPMGAWANAYNAVPAQLLSAGDDGCIRLVSVHISGHT
ncbi:Elongator subunit elp2 [Malassezia nana]|uniref:Elongator complex protein 2 n=1 Tax=Malassezia nana TaxID=180528 RepID=A0AAF0EK56_9BASI|nr:Elongator subunit elp2 [Malassezia nana]